MINYLKYFSPFLFIAFLILYRPYLGHLEKDDILLFSVFKGVGILLSIYWAVGFWIPMEVSKTAISVGLGIATLIIASLVVTSIDLLAPILIPFLLFATLLIRKFNT